jgi:hypothetical protein
MGRRSPESMVKRAREQNLREKRELKQAKKDARAAAKLANDAPPELEGDVELEGDAEEQESEPEPA